MNLISKTRYASSMLLAMLFFSSFIHSQSWTIQHPFPGYQRYNDVYIDATGFGWLVGTNGAISKTMDSGATWETLPPITTEELRRITYIPGSGGQVALVSTLNSMMKTMDGGTTWQPVEFLEELGSIITIEVASETTLFLSDWTGKLFKSTDTGATWTLLMEEPDKDFVGISFFTESTGWITTANGEVHYTSDGGESWSLMADLMLSSVRDLDFYDENTGYLVANGGLLYKTTDGGQNWAEHDMDGFPSNASKLWIANANEMYALPSAGTKMLYSSDGGLNWESRTIIDHIYNDFNNLLLTDDGKLWVVGEYQVVATSDDKGLTWEDVFDADKANLNFVTFVDENIGFSGGAGYHFLKTTDGGMTWENVGNQGPIMTGMTIGENGKLFYSRGYSGIFESVDEGTNWTNILSGVGFIRTVVASPAGHLFASSAINSYRIYRSTDNGSTWDYVDTPDELDVRGITFVTETKGYAWGDAQLLETTDGGDTWNYSEDDFSQSIGDVHFINASHGWLMTAYALFSTTDGGATWNELTKPGQAFTLAFKDENAGWAAGGNANQGAIYKTTDGGMSWELQKSGDYSYRDLAFSDLEEEKLIAVGSGGIIEYYDASIINDVEEAILPTLTVFPNPGDDVIQLKDIPSSGILRIYSTIGQLQKVVRLQNEGETINVADLSPGVYFFHYDGGTKQWGGKWVKKD